jgi:hypothetical protein
MFDLLPRYSYNYEDDHIVDSIDAGEQASGILA